MWVAVVVSYSDVCSCYFCSLSKMASSCVSFYMCGSSSKWNKSFAVEIDNIFVVWNIFCSTSRAPTFVNSFAHLEITASQCSPYFSSCSHFFEKYGFAFWICHSLFTLTSKLLSWMWMAYSIDKSIYFSKKCSQACVCSFFFVTLRPK